MRRRTGTLLMTLLAAAVAAAPAAAQSSDYSYIRIVRLSLVEGDVQVQRPDTLEWEQGLANLPIKHGYRLATGHGRAEVEFESGATARLASNTLLHFSELALENGARLTRITMRYGTATFNANLERRDVFRVSTPHLEGEISDNSSFRLDVTEDGTWITVHRGHVALNALGGGYYRLARGRAAYVNAYGQATLERAADPDAWDRWVSERDGVLVAASARARQYTSAPFSYGFADLYYYGAWSNVPGYGYCWQPYSAGLGWSPFLLGRWVFLRGIGWTWISYEPWGWVPYHYGRWVFVSYRGWVWVPGHFGRFHGGPVHWVRVGGRIGWVPQSPHDRPGRPANMTHGTIVKTAGGVTRADLAGEHPLLLDSEPDLTAMGFSDRGSRGSRDRPGEFTGGPGPSGFSGGPSGGASGAGPRPRQLRDQGGDPESGAIGGHPGAGRSEQGTTRGGRSRGDLPLTRDPDSGVVFDPREGRFTNNPNVRPTVPLDPESAPGAPAAGPGRRPPRDSSGEVGGRNPSDTDRGSPGRGGSPFTGAPSTGAPSTTPGRGPAPGNPGFSPRGSETRGEIGRPQRDGPAPSPPPRPSGEFSRPHTAPPPPPPPSPPPGARPPSPPPAQPQSAPPPAARPAPPPPPRPQTSAVGGARPSAFRPSEPPAAFRRPAPAERPSAPATMSRPAGPGAAAASRPAQGRPSEGRPRPH